MAVADPAPRHAPPSEGADEAAAAQAHADWCAERRAQVDAPAGNLALVGYHAVEAEAPVDGFPVAAAPAPGRDGVWVTPLRDGLTLDGAPFTARALVPRLRPDGTPLLRHGTRTADVFSLDGSSWELRLYDAQAPRRAAFAGIEVYPHDPAWRLEARFERYETTAQQPWGFTRLADAGHTKKVPGRLHVDLDGQALALVAFLDGAHLVVVFGDGGSGVESYAPGRFLRLPCPAQDGPVVLDFNRAFIPPCGFSDHYSCPIPPADNQVRAVVRAGEKRVRWRAGTAPGH